MTQENNISKVLIPQVTTNDTEVTLAEWYVKDDDIVQKGDIIFSIETAKSIADIESEFSGHIVRIRKEKDLIKVGDIAAFIGRDLKALKDEKTLFLSNQLKIKSKSEAIATKKAIKLANELDINIELIKKDGIIRVEDIKNYASSNTEIVESIENEKLVDLNNYQKEIINTISWQKENAIVGYIEKIMNIKKVIQFSKNLKIEKKWIFDPFFPIIAFHFSKIIKNNIDYNATIKNEKYCKYSKLNLGFTLDIEDKLLIGVFSDACQFEQDKFIENIFSIQKRTISGNIKPNEVNQPTIGITSLSSHSISRHIPILLPYTSIMFAISDILPNANDKGIYCSFGITYDHRLHSGTQISQLLNKFDHSINNIDVKSK